MLVDDTTARYSILTLPNEREHMNKQEIARIKELQRRAAAIQKELNDALIKALTTGGKLSLEDLEISVDRLGAFLGAGRAATAARQPINAARQPPVASRRNIVASRRPIDASRRPLKA